MALEALCADVLLHFHETVPAFFDDVLRHMAFNGVGIGLGDVFVAEATDTIKLRVFEPIEQILEIFFRFAGEADDKRRSHD